MGRREDGVEDERAEELLVIGKEEERKRKSRGRDVSCSAERGVPIFKQGQTKSSQGPKSKPTLRLACVCVSGKTIAMCGAEDGYGRAVLTGVYVWISVDDGWLGWMEGEVRRVKGMGDGAPSHPARGARDGE
jgi:hypothetical protein